MIIQETVLVTLNGSNISYYENLGYSIPKYYDVNNILSVKKRTKIEVKVSDLPKNSHVKVLCKCEICGKEKIISYQHYKPICFKCKMIEIKKEKLLNQPKTKVCRYCHKRKLISSFQHGNCCKKCYKYYMKNYRENHKKEAKLYRIKNKQILNQKRKEKYKNNKQYREKIKEYNKKRQKENKEKRRLEQQKYYYKKLKDDPVDKIKRTLRRRILLAVKEQRTEKAFRTIELVGCSIQQLSQYLQQTAINNGYLDFNINDYSGLDYHIDHIIPCSSFNLKCNYHQKLCFNWSNLQILKAELNESKGNRFLLK